jgi:GDP-4-dehydro-6-deoxy-D-mannose reductase
MWSLSSIPHRSLSRPSCCPIQWIESGASSRLRYNPACYFDEKQEINVRVLITGAGGFVGKHLSRHLAETQPDSEIHGTTLESPAGAHDSPVIFHQLDLRDSQAVQSLIDQIRPDHVYHLAALSSPSQSFLQPWTTIENNVNAQRNILDSCLAFSSRILIVSSADLYDFHDMQRTITEDSPICAASPYAMSKYAQDMMGLEYNQKLPVVRVRPFNHTGPGQSPGFVAADFATQIAEIEAGQREEVIKVRNLQARVDFTDVRDVARAYALLMGKGMPGDVYNLASEKTYRVEDLLNILLSNSSVRPRIETSGNQRDSFKSGSAERLRSATGWEPTIPFEQTLLDLLNDCRQRLQQSAAKRT